MDTLTVQPDDKKEATRCKTEKCGRKSHIFFTKCQFKKIGTVSYSSTTNNMCNNCFLIRILFSNTFFIPYYLRVFVSLGYVSIRMDTFFFNLKKIDGSHYA
jgi:hypothetical protein